MHGGDEQVLTALTEEQNSEPVDVAGILAEYRRKQLLENMAGPAISLTLHVVVLTLMFLYIATRTTEEKIQAVEVTIVKEKVTVLEPPETDDFPREEPTIDAKLLAPEVTEAPSEEVGENTSIANFDNDQPETADEMDTCAVLDVLNHQGPLHLPGLYGGRSNKGRATALKIHGAPPGSEIRVSRALKWLALVQNDDGSWGNQSPAHTGFALLTFLAHGETPLSEKYGTTVQKAMKWLVDKEMSTADGFMGQQAYGHGIATYALAESYGMTRIPFLRTATERALYVIVKGQQDGGGFNYNYEKAARWDTSVAGWQAQALKAGYVAGCTVGGIEEAIRKCTTFLRRTSYANYKFGYSNQGSGPGSGGNMTGIGTVGLQLLGAGGSAEAQGGVRTIGQERLALYQGVMNAPATWDAVMGPNLYGFYYDTQAIFNAQASAGGAATWKEWRNVFENVLRRAQQPEGYWEVKSGWGLGTDLPGRIMATTQACLQLEVYYRYLPTFDMNKMDQHKIVGAGGDNIDEAGGKNDGGAVVRIQ